MKFNIQKIFSQFFSKKGLVYALIAVFSLTAGFALANPPSSPYAPGATLAPTCAPGSLNCTVTTPFVESGSDEGNAIFLEGPTVNSFEIKLTGADATADRIVTFQDKAGTVALLSDITGSTGITSLNGLTGTSQTFATGTSGTDFNISSAGTAHTFNFPNASASNRGLLTSADWSIFNGNLLPSQTGNSGKVLSTDGANTSWISVGGTGTVTSVSVVSANGFSGSVTNPTTTPAITLSTTQTGILSGNGTAISGITTSAGIAGQISDETGTGALVFGTSPTLVTPNLGTPSVLVGTNITGTASGLTAGNVTTNANLTGAITSVGNSTSLGSGSFSSANLSIALTDETGAGAAVFATSPTLVTPILGTPTSVTLTNATGLPISTGVSGLGANVATFLATPSSANLISAVTDETGTGALVFGTSPTLVTPNLGTPSVLVGTNITGTASGLTAGNVTTNANLTGAITSVGNSTSLGSGSFSSANLSIALTDETGAGAAVFATSPTLVTPNLGTPSVLVGTNITGTASGLTAGLATALAANGTNCVAGSYPLGVDASGNAEVCTVAGTGTVTSVSSANGDATVATSTTTPVITIVSAPKLTTARTIGGISFDGTANITVASATGGFTVSGGDLALGANNITMSGSLGTTGTRLTKGWFTDLEVTNPIVGSITGNAATVTTNANLTGAITSVGNATSLGSFTSALLSGALTDETGSGAAVFANSPTLVTPNLGTPSTLVGTNITGTAAGLTAGTVTTNANLTGAITSVGNATSLGSFSSANLSIALTDETGAGAAVFATSPTLVTPNLGTPSTLVGTNITGTASSLTAGLATSLSGGLGGQIPYQSAVNTTAFLANGTAGQVLQSNGGALAPSWVASGGTGTVTNVSVVTTNGVSGSVTNPTTTPAITLTLGAITPITVNGLTITPNGSNTLNIAAGKTLTSSNTLTFAGTDGSTLNIGTGGTLGTNAFTSTAFAPLASPTFTGTVTIPTPFTLGATSVTSTGTQLNYLNAATGTTGTTSSNLVFSNSPTLVTPNLGTPSVLVGTNITGTASGLTAGLATALAADGANCALGSYPLGVDAFGAVQGCTVAGTGTVTNVSVVSANGFSGSVTNPTTTPAITLSTTQTGILSGNGTAISGITTSAGIAGQISDETGTGSLVFGTSPTLVTPNLGTPSTLVGTNITGTAAGLTAGTVTTNANLTGAITSVGNATSLGSFSSANLSIALTDETGAGAAVFATSPTLVTPSITATAQANGNVPLCVPAAGGLVRYGASATSCNRSSRRFKHDINNLDLGLAALLALRPVDYRYNDNNDYHNGLIAEEVYSVIPSAVVLDTQGLPFALDYNDITPVIIQAVQDQQLLLGDISTTAGLSTLIADVQAEAAHNPITVIGDKVSAGKKLLTDFVVARVTAIRGYFDEVFANTSHQKTLCVGDPGNETCITKAQLDALLSGPPPAGPAPSGGGTGGSTGGTGGIGGTGGGSDTTAPVITLNGNSSISLNVGDTYTEPGATATDNIDASVSVAIGGSTVDTSTAGTYTVTYNAIDAAGNHATEVTRTVTVGTPPPPPANPAPAGDPAPSVTP